MATIIFWLWPSPTSYFALRCIRYFFFPFHVSYGLHFCCLLPFLLYACPAFQIEANLLHYNCHWRRLHIPGGFQEPVCRESQVLFFFCFDLGPWPKSLPNSLFKVDQGVLVGHQLVEDSIQNNHRPCALFLWLKYISAISPSLPLCRLLAKKNCSFCSVSVFLFFCFLNY